MVSYLSSEGFQAVQLEDGSTAYITSTCAQNLFGDGEHFDPSALNLDQLGTQFDEAPPDVDNKSSTIPMTDTTMNRDISAVNVVSVSVLFFFLIVYKAILDLS
jgi:hypothetical protein